MDHDPIQLGTVPAQSKQMAPTQKSLQSSCFYSDSDLFLTLWKAFKNIKDMTMNKIIAIMFNW